MARPTAQERREASTVTVLSPDDAPYDDDVEASFDEWRSSLGSGETPGILRAYMLPFDDQGNPNVSAKNQTRLGAWPIDMYAFDDLCSMLVAQFMTAGQTMAVRLLGYKPGARGVQFNRIVILRAPKAKVDPGGNGAAPESTAALMQAISENNRQLMAQFRELFTQRAPPDPSAELGRIMTVARSLNEPTNELMKLLLPAIVGRAPAAAAPAPDPFTQLTGLLGVLEKVQDLRIGGGDGDGGDSSGPAGIIRAVGEAAAPVAEILRHMPRALPAPGAPPPPGVAAPGAPAAPPAAARPAHGPAPGSQPTQPSNAPPIAGAATGDIPTGDREMFAQLKPQVDALVTMAAQGSDAAGAAAMLFEQIIDLPDEYYDRLYTMVAADSFVRNLTVLNPAAAAHSAWFEAFRAKLLALYADEDAAAKGGTPTPPG